jgi:hypothetical protein
MLRPIARAGVGRREATMNPPQKYTGIYWRKRRPQGWQVRFSFKNKQVMLGYYDDPKIAAWVADFAKYLCFGLNPAKWHHNAAKPNFPPRNMDRYLRDRILRKLADNRVLRIDELQKRLAEYDAAAG